MKNKICIFIFSLFIHFSVTADPKAYDICVYGETVAGISAAIQAARMGKSVVLVSKNNHIGGTTTSGLTATDMNRNQLVGGIAREFYQRIYAWYSNPAAWRNQDREEFFIASRHRTYTGKNDSLKKQWVYESHVAEQILKEMLHENGVEVLYNERLDLSSNAVKRRSRIQRIRMESGLEIEAMVFVDATYEGDLMAKAGVSYVVGREGNKKYGETLNGIRPNHIIGKGNQSIDPYRVEGDPSSGLLPFVDNQLWGKPGEPDNRTQTYCYRLTLTNDPSNRVEITKPEGFNPLWHEILVRELQLNPDKPLQKIVSLTPMPNKKTDSNFLNMFGNSYDYPEGDYATRAKIEQEHKDYALGMLWVLKNDPRVPEHIQQEIAEWGLPRDEFQDTDHFPNQIYVREARRMVGSFVMTEHHVAKNNREDVPKPIGLGSYAMDCHFVSRFVDEQGRLWFEGTMFEPTAPYAISYDAIVPKAAECQNLIVPICLSASHVAYASIRMEPTYMVLGQAAGTAAALAIDEGAGVQNVPYKKLSDRLTADKQILNP